MSTEDIFTVLICRGEVSGPSWPGDRKTLPKKISKTGFRAKLEDAIIPDDGNPIIFSIP